MSSDFWIPVWLSHSWLSHELGMHNVKACRKTCSKCNSLQALTILSGGDIVRERIHLAEWALVNLAAHRLAGQNRFEVRSSKFGGKSWKEGLDATVETLGVVRTRTRRRPFRSRGTGMCAYFTARVSREGAALI